MALPDGPLTTGALRIGLGLAALGRPAYITLGRAQDIAGRRTPDKLEERTHAVLDAAWEAGVRYVDAARSYGDSERFLGSWLAEHPGRRDQLVVGSKWGYRYVGEWKVNAPVHEVKDHGVEAFDEQWPETLEALGGPPDVYHVHSVTPDSPALADPELLARLRELAAGGVRVGFSTSGPAQGEAVDLALGLAGSPYRVVQATWNLLERSVGPALARAHDAEWFVVVKEAVANGRLTSHGDETEAEDLAFDDDQSLDAYAIGWALAQPFVDLVLSGAVSVAQLESNLAARPTTARASGVAALAGPADEYWAARAAMPWR